MLPQLISALLLGLPGCQEITYDAIPDTAVDTTEVTDTEDTDTHEGTSGDEAFVDPCAVTFTYEAQGSPTGVSVAGDFNGWDASAHPLELESRGVWSVVIPREEIPPGTYAYKFVEHSGSDQAWTCDPNAGLIQCDDGYRDPSDTSWTHTCGLNVESCNSLIVVDDFDRPRLTVESLAISAEAGTVSASVGWAAGCAGDALGEAVATLDGEPLDGTWETDGVEISLDTLSPGRHTLRLNASDTAGRAAEEAYIPFWLEDEGALEGGLMYYAFLDRLVDGDGSRNTSEGASCELASYMGGDFQGLIDALPYLEDLGVTVIWISNPQDNSEGAYGGDCGSYSGYHGYWPDMPYAVEEHFGSETTLKDLVDRAHDRDMRVVMDWVANHVHDSHPYVAEHPDWFNQDAIPCKESDGNGGWDYSNFDEYPEVCWFAGYLPDFNYYEPEPLSAVVEEALWWVREFDLDGFRVDGAKHVPHSLVWNLTTRLDQEVEHSYAGGDQDFYTVGETFSTSSDWIAAYVNDNELDAQFDFPHYFALRSAFIDDSASLPDLAANLQSSKDVYGDAVMSTFLGNHDVARFVSEATAGSWANSDESSCYIADVVDEDWWLGRLNLAWTWLLTHPGLPLVYYGDELGMPGYRDPDNRHPLWWYSSAINGGSGGEFDLAAMSDGLYHPTQGKVLWHLAALGQARLDHSALWRGFESTWWSESDIYAYARVDGDDEALVIINRGWEDRTLENSVSYANLDTDATFEDVLTGETFSTSGDFLSVWVPGNGSRVLVKR